MPGLESFRVVPSPEEVSLHPRAIWKHWQEHVFWDHRSYYGFLEFVGGSVLALFLPGLKEDSWTMAQRAFEAVVLLLGIIPIHWYSNQRFSNHLFTRARTHLAVISTIFIVILISQIFSISHRSSCYDCQVTQLLYWLLWLALLGLAAAGFVVYTAARNPKKDPILAELPSPIDVEDEATQAWASANVADGIEDDSVEPEGQYTADSKFGRNVFEFDNCYINGHIVQPLPSSTQWEIA